MLAAGDHLPPLRLPDQTDQPRTLAELAGPAGLVLFVYSRDNTAGCTTEAREFQGLLPDYQALGYGVAGLSKDTPASHQKFAAKQGLTFPLLADPNTAYLRALGAWGAKKLYGKVSEGAIRSTFVAGPAGVLRLVHPKVKAAGHAAALLALLRGA
ncbi:MAG: peroxiredoxin [Deltaproteobacteria bacterium]|nr:peroxiredoxin [Deltaproteobacteria bacterium]MCB2186342.1 peroxiredoxin [Deltaproteobacteria bacterium]